MIYIPDLFNDIVGKVNVALSAKGFNQTVYFDKGHYSEIVNNLNEKDKSTSRTAKYPLVWLVKDFEQKTSKLNEMYCELPKVQVIIATSTDINYTEEDRKEKTYKPILYPVFEEFINQLSKSAVFGMPNIQQMGYSWWERSYWGKGGANIFNDFADVIEINNLKLNINKTCISKQFQTN